MSTRVKSNGIPPMWMWKLLICNLRVIVSARLKYATAPKIARFNLLFPRAKFVANS